MMSLVLGIISIAIALLSVGMWGWVGAIIGVIGIILGANDRKNSLEEMGAIATAGFVCSILGIILNILFFLACAACVGAVDSL